MLFLDRAPGMTRLVRWIIKVDVSMPTEHLSCFIIQKVVRKMWLYKVVERDMLLVTVQSEADSTFLEWKIPRCCPTYLCLFSMAVMGIFRNAWKERCRGATVLPSPPTGSNSLASTTQSSSLYAASLRSFLLRAVVTKPTHLILLPFLYLLCLVLSPPEFPAVKRLV